MLVKFGGGIVDARGSMAGNTFSRSRFGNYVRARTVPVNPRSSRQVASRAIIMYLAEQWRETPMTDVIRGAWETYANSVGWLNKLGETVNLTGFNHFIRSNAALLSIGGALVTAGPTDLALPAGDPSFAVTASEATGLLSVTFDDGFDWLDEDGGWMSIQMGVPQNPSRNFFGGPWRTAGGIEGDSVTPPTTPATITAPYTLIEGQKCWVRASIIREDGRVSNKFEGAPVTIAA